MYRKLILIIAVFAAYGYSLNAQHYNEQAYFLKANSIWAFGRNAGLDFNAGSPIPVPLQTAIYSEEACATVSDSSTGQLLFYLGSNGTIWNRNHAPMLNGTGLSPYHTAWDGSSSAQGVVIVPVIDTPWKYYVFVNTSYEGYGVFNGPNNITPSTPSPYLSYSVVDMTLDNGLGGVVPGRKNIPLYSYGLHESMIAIPGNNCDVWLVSAASSAWPNVPADPGIPADTFSLLAWHITGLGIDPNPVRSTPAPVRGDSAWSTAIMSVSPDRQRIALGMRRNTLLCRFNPGTGSATDGIILPVGPGLTSYGNCFSPDNTKLYISTLYSSLRQYDVSVYDSATIMSSEYYVTTSGWEAALKLYGGLIFVVPFTFSNMRVIVNPNAAGAACDFRPTMPLHPATRARLGLPTEVVFPAAHAESFVTHDSICYSEGTGYISKSLSAPGGYAFYEWDNRTAGDTREITVPGVYWVRYYDKTCLVYTDTFYIGVRDLSLSLGRDTTMFFCAHPQSYLQLRVTVPYPDAVYRWQDGSSGVNYRVTAPGKYWVEVNQGGCSISDTVRVESVVLQLTDTVVCEGSLVDVMLQAPDVPPGTVVQWSTGSTASSIHVADTGLYWVRLINPPCVLTDTAYITMTPCDTFPPPPLPPESPVVYYSDVRIPSAFSPNGDGINDVFRLLNIRDEELSAFRVLNRYGQVVFEARSLQDGWDGTFRGSPAEGGVYFYFARVELPDGTSKVYKGDVTLVR